VEKLLDFIAVLIRDADGAPEPEVDADFEEQQHMVGFYLSPCCFAKDGNDSTY